VAPNERARKHHEELFPGHVSTLAVTDPELIEAFDTFAFDEVLRHGNLDTSPEGSRRGAAGPTLVEIANRQASQAFDELNKLRGE
jgi:4-carboxymuconolactone decarboxylase